MSTFRLPVGHATAKLNTVMDPDRQQAIAYLRAPPSGLWRWVEESAVIVWHDGTTIAFREELIQILEWLSRSGLPPFGAIVLLLAACRGKVPSAAQVLSAAETLLPAELGAKAAILLAARRQLTLQVDEALAELAKVSRLLPEFRSGLVPKCVLAEAVFEPARAERHVDADAILRGLRDPLTDSELNATGDVAINHVRHVQILAEGLKLYSQDALALRLRTGLDVLPEKTDINLPPAERARKLIEELSRDPEYGAVARAARELTAAVRLPRHLGQREELAIGGVADITNRGPLDRLLISELAHDDLTLAVRVAINEALYLRREPPMREPPGTLAVLLDSGVRLWGVPRVLATALALATIACDKQHAQVMVWRARGKELLPVDLLSRQGLIDHLSALEVDAHPGEALASFAGALPAGTHNQAVVITHSDALRDQEFRRALGNSPAEGSFVAAVNRAGRFQLQALPLAHRRPLCEADLDLDAIFEKKTPVVPLINPQLAPNLPAIFGVSPFPFLLPFAAGVSKYIKAPDDFTYAVLSDRSLIRFRDTKFGGRVLVPELPAGRTAWIGYVNEHVHVIKAAANQRPCRLVSVPASGGESRVIDLLSGPELVAAHAYGEVVLLIRHQDVRAYSLADGKLLGRVVVPYRWVHGRYFSSESAFYFVNWDGSKLGFSPVTLPRSYSASVIASIFDRHGVEGPWIVHRSGEIISTATGESVKIRRPDGRAYGIDVAAISDNGHRLALGGGSPPWSCTVDMRTGQTDVSRHGSSKRLDLRERCVLPTWNVYRLFESIAISSDGLGLCRKGRWRKLCLDGSTTIRITELAGYPKEAMVHFSPTPERTSTRYGCSLDVAQWSNGSRAFLDSRGLLHLKSHDRSVAEVSVVLGDREVAGWTSDGYVCGPQFFFEGPYKSEPRKVYERVEEFMRRL